MKNKVIYILTVVVFLIIALEFSLRSLGYSPLKITNFSIESNPRNAISYDLEKYIKLNNGQFEIIINKELKYLASHEDNKRITHNSKNKIDSSNLLIDFYGCSYTYGQGLDDSTTFPYLVDNYFESIAINNYGIPGYGTINVLNFIKTNFSTKNKPNQLIYFYANFHRKRNILNQQRKNNILKSLNKTTSLDLDAKKLQIPYGEIINDKLKIKKATYKDLNPTIFLLQQKSSIINFISQNFSNSLKQEAILVTSSAIKEIKDLCDRNDIAFTIAFLTEHDNDPIYSYCKKNKIDILDIYINLEKEGFRNLPFDRHPSALANKFYAKKIIENLNKQN